MNAGARRVQRVYLVLLLNGPHVDGASARVSGLRRCFRKDGQQETARIADLERAALPLRVARLRLERDAGILRPLRYLVDAARRRDRQAHADSLLAVAPLLPIVLVQADLALARAQHHAEQRPFLFPPLVDREAERLVKGDALLQIVDSQGGNDSADLHSFLRCRHDSLLLLRLVSFIRRLAGFARIVKRGRAEGILRGRTSLGGRGRAAPSDGGVNAAYWYGDVAEVRGQ